MENAIGILLVVISGLLFARSKYWKSRFEQAQQEKSERVIDDVLTQAKKNLENSPLQSIVDASNARYFDGKTNNPKKK